MTYKIKSQNQIHKGLVTRLAQAKIFDLRTPVAKR